MVEQFREKQMFRWSEVAMQLSNRALVEIRDELSAETERSDLTEIALARVAFALRIREGNGDYDPAA